MRRGPRTGGDECGSIVRGDAIHHVTRRRGGVVLRRARAAAGADAADRCADGYAESDLEGQALVAAFREGRQKLGWTESRNIRIDTRWAAVELMQRFAREIVELQLDLILSDH